MPPNESDPASTHKVALAEFEAALARAQTEQSVLDQILVERLAAADSGNAELDHAIALALGWTVHDDQDATPRSLREEGKFWKFWIDPSDGRAENNPPNYTTNLDAKLPWERIVSVQEVQLADHVGYRAFHRVPAGTLFDAAVFGNHAEARARRIAALKGAPMDLAKFNAALRAANDALYSALYSQRGPAS